MEETITNLSPCPRLADIVLHCILTSPHCIVVHCNTMYSDQKTLSYVVFQHRHCNTYNILHNFRFTDIVIHCIPTHRHCNTTDSTHWHCMLYCIVLHFITLYYIVFRLRDIVILQRSRKAESGNCYYPRLFYRQRARLLWEKN